MTVRDYRDLMDMMLDGVICRKNHKEKRDPDADYVYSEILTKLRHMLPEAERNKLVEAMFAETEAVR